MKDAEHPDPAALATVIERLLATAPEDGCSTTDRVLRARLEGYVTGLRGGDPGLQSLD